MIVTRRGDDRLGRVAKFRLEPSGPLESLKNSDGRIKEAITAINNAAEAVPNKWLDFLQSDITTRPMEIQEGHEKFYAT